MKINIQHIVNTFNYGSFMMAITTISKINENIKNVEFYTDASSDEDLERLKKETGVENIIRYNIESSTNFFKRCVNKIRRMKLNHVVKKIENVIIIGGDDISEYYTIQRLERELARLKNDSKSKNIILLGQTIGPFTENRGELARTSLKDTKIYSRDDKCLEYLLKLNFKNVNFGRDLAFAEFPMQFKAKSILNKYNLKTDEYITIVISGLTKCYTKNFNNYIEEQVNIIKKVFMNDKLMDKKIVILPHVTRPEDTDDRIVIKKVINRLYESYNNKIIDIYDEMLASEAREILGNGLFTITGRMHASVSTFYMRKPAISLSYSVKYEGVISKGIDMRELVIECTDEKLWQNGKISELVDDKFNYILENYDDLIKKIDAKVSEISKIVQGQLNEVSDNIKFRETQKLKNGELG